MTKFKVGDLVKRLYGADNEICMVVELMELTVLMEVSIVIVTIEVENINKYHHSSAKNLKLIC